MGRIIQIARQLADYVVVDCGFSLERDEEVMYDTAAPRRNGATIEVLERADLVLLVGARRPGGAEPAGPSRPRARVGGARMRGRGSWSIGLARALGWSSDEMTATHARDAGPGAGQLSARRPAAVDRACVQGTTLVECAPDAKLTRAVTAWSRSCWSADVDAGRQLYADRPARAAARASRAVRTRRAARGR